MGLILCWVQFHAYPYLPRDGLTMSVLTAVLGQVVCDRVISQHKGLVKDFKVFSDQCNLNHNIWDMAV